MVQLEAFRRQKAEKKQPSKATVAEEAPSKPADLSRPSGAAPEAVGLPVSSNRGSSKQQYGGLPSQGITAGKGEGSTASLPASGTVQAPSVAQNGHTSCPTGFGPQQHVEPAVMGDKDSASAEALSAGSEAPAARQRTARSLFSGGLPAPPPLPLPPTPSSRYHLPAPLSKSSRCSYKSAALRQIVTFFCQTQHVCCCHLRVNSIRRESCCSMSCECSLTRARNQTGNRVQPCTMLGCCEDAGFTVGVLDLKCCNMTRVSDSSQVLQAGLDECENSCEQQRITTAAALTAAYHESQQRRRRHKPGCRRCRVPAGSC